MKLASLDRNKTYTYADYAQWDFPERVELIDGKIYEVMAGPSPYHQEIVGDLFAALRQFVRDRPCKVFFAPVDVFLPGAQNTDTVLQPDLFVVCDLVKMSARGCEGAPDIVAEVLSPGNSVKEMKIKYLAYQRAGVQEYWVVAPANLLFIVYRLINGKFEQDPVKTVGDTVTSSVLPGFSLLLEELFRNAPAGE